MFRIAVFVTVALFINSATAGPLGEWYCTGTGKSVIKIKGKNTRTTDSYSSYITLAPDGTYVGQNPTVPFPATGRYTVRGRNVKFFPNLDELARAAEYGCSIAGTPCTVVAVAGTLKAKLNRGGNLARLNAKTALTLYFPDSNILARSKSQLIGRCDRL